MGKAENYVEDYLRQQAQKHHALCYKFVSPGTNGVPDDIVIFQGQVIFIETKSPVGHAREIQKERIKQMQEQGAIVHICHTRTAIDNVLGKYIPAYQKARKTANTKPTKAMKKPTSTTIPPVRRAGIRIEERSNSYE